MDRLKKVAHGFKFLHIDEMIHDSKWLINHTCHLLITFKFSPFADPLMSSDTFGCLIDRT